MQYQITLRASVSVCSTNTLKTDEDFSDGVYFVHAATKHPFRRRATPQESIWVFQKGRYGNGAVHTPLKGESVAFLLLMLLFDLGSLLCSLSSAPPWQDVVKEYIEKKPGINLQYRKASKKNLQTSLCWQLIRNVSHNIIDETIWIRRSLRSPRSQLWSKVVWRRLHDKGVSQPGYQIWLD